MDFCKDCKPTDQLMYSFCVTIVSSPSGLRFAVLVVKVLILSPFEAIAGLFLPVNVI